MTNEITALTTLTGAAVAGLADRTLKKEVSHVLFVDPDETKSQRSRRAQLVYNPKEHDLAEWALPVDPRAADRAEPMPADASVAGRVTEERLSNGVRVLLARDRRFPTIDARLVFPRGKSASPADDPCVAEMTAYSLTYGAQAHGRRARKALMRMAGSERRLVLGDTTVFGIHGLAPYQDGLLWQLGWLVIGGSYNSYYVDTLLPREPSESFVTKQAKRRRRVEASLFGGDSACKDLQAAELNPAPAAYDAFRDAHYLPANATLVLAGDWDDKTLQRARNYFGTWSAAGNNEPVANVPQNAKKGERVVLVDDRAAQASFMLGLPLGGGASEDAARAVLRALVDQRVSRLRARLAATYSTSAIISDHFGPHSLYVGGDFDSTRGGEMLKALRAELEAIRRGDGLQEAFVRARKAALRAALSSSSDSGAVADELTMLARRGAELAALERLPKEIAALTLADLRQVIERDLLVDDALILVVGPEKEAVEAVRAGFGAATRVIKD